MGDAPVNLLWVSVLAEVYYLCRHFDRQRIRWVTEIEQVIDDETAKRWLVARRSGGLTEVLKIRKP